MPLVSHRIEIAELRLVAPDVVLVVDDGGRAELIESLRMLRFALPDCTIAVYSGTLYRMWARACHLAGVNCMLAQTTGHAAAAAGLRRALSTGCFIDRAYEHPEDAAG